MSERPEDDDAADKEWLDAYQRGVADAKTGARVAGAVEANAALAKARARQRRFTNEELERFSAPPEWGVLYEPPKRGSR